MKRLEATIILVGAVLVCIALAAYDWRLGVLAFGVALIFLSVDLRRPAT